MTDKSFAELLDHLFRTVHPKGRGSYTYEQVSQGIRETSGLKISASAIQQLRTGVNKNPKRDTIRALAGFFKVKSSYFFDEEEAERQDEEEVERQLAKSRLLAAMRDQGVRRIALRANGLSAESLDMVTSVINQTRRLEGMSESQESDLLDDE